MTNDMNKLNTDYSLRSKRLGINISMSIILQILSMFISFISLPISLKFVNVSQYGIWLTISSIIMWISYFDLGIGTGLKNMLADALATDDKSLAKRYVSTAYIYLTAIMVVLGLIFYFLSSKIGWNHWLTNNLQNEGIIKVIEIVVYFFLLKFILQLINIILEAMQLLFIARLNETLTQLIVIICLVTLPKFVEGNLFILGLIYSLAPLIILITCSSFVFYKYSFLRPSLKYFEKKLLTNIFSLGMKFFLIKLSMLMIFQTSSIIILKYFGPLEVVQYNVSFGLFNILTIGFSTFAAPFWSAYTNAWASKDITWIKNTHKKLIRAWILFVSVAFIVLVFSKEIYALWLQKDLKIPFTLSLLLFIYNTVFSFGYVNNMFINGIGKIKLQGISLFIGAVIYLPFVFLFINIFKLNIEGIVLAMIVSNFYLPIIAPIQYYKIINNKSEGIWNK